MNRTDGPVGKDVARSVLPTLMDVVVPVAGFFVLRGVGVPAFWALTIAASVSVSTVVAERCGEAD